MPTSTRTVLPVALYTDLAQTSAAFDVPANLLGLTLRMVSTEFLDAAMTVDLSVEESDDAGQSWRPVAGITASGGLDKNGNPRQPTLRIDFTREQRATALMRAVLVTQGSWHYGFVADLTT